MRDISLLLSSLVLILALQLGSAREAQAVTCTGLPSVTRAGINADLVITADATTGTCAFNASTNAGADLGLTEGFQFGVDGDQLLLFSWYNGGTHFVGTAAGSATNADVTGITLDGSAANFTNSGATNPDLGVDIVVQNAINTPAPGPYPRAFTFTGTFTQCGTTYNFSMEAEWLQVGPVNVRMNSASVTGGSFSGLPGTACTTGFITAQDKSNTAAALQMMNALNAMTPGLLDGSGLPLNGAGTTNGNGISFSPTGLSFNRAPLDHANPLDRDYGPAFVDKGWFARNGSSRHRNNGFNFSADLQGLAAASRKKEAEVLGVHVGGLKDSAYQPRSRFNSWVKGEYIDFDDDETNADRDGHMWVVTSGMSLRVGEKTTMGVLSRYREGEVDSTALTATLESEFYGGGAFLATTLGGGLRIAVAALYEHGENDISITGDTGAFDSQTTTIEGRMDKRITRGRTWIEPAVTIRYVDTSQDDFTDSAGTLVVGQNLTLGRLTYGPTIGTTIQRGNVQIRPFAKINGVWDFENEGSFVTSGGGVAAGAGAFTSPDNALNLGSGVEIAYASGLKLKLAGDWFTFDTELQGWTLSGGLGAPLSAFGLGTVAPTGFVSLDLAANADDASATARVRIPLN